MSRPDLPLFLEPANQTSEMPPVYFSYLSLYFLFAAIFYVGVTYGKSFTGFIIHRSVTLQLPYVTRDNRYYHRDLQYISVKFSTNTQKNTCRVFRRDPAGLEPVLLPKRKDFFSCLQTTQVIALLCAIIILGVRRAESREVIFQLEYEISFVFLPCHYLRFQTSPSPL